MRISFTSASLRSVAIATAVGLSFTGVVVPASAAPLAVATSADTQKLENLKARQDVGETTGQVFAYYAGDNTFVVTGKGKIDKSKFNPKGDKDKRGFISQVQDAVGKDVSDYKVKIESDVQFPDDSSHLFDGLRLGLDFDPAIDTSNVTNMSFMFAFTTTPTPNLRNWNTSNVTDMSSMFSGAEAANPDTSLWDTGKVEDMKGMFFGAEVANPNTTNWNTANVTNMNNVFAAAPVANPDTRTWDVANVINFGSAFAGSGTSVIDTRKWDTKLLSHNTPGPFDRLSATSFERFVFTAGSKITLPFPIPTHFSLDADTELVLSKITDDAAYNSNPASGKATVTTFTGTTLSQEVYASLEEGTSYEIAKAPQAEPFITANDVTVPQGTTLTDAELIRQANARAAGSKGENLKVTVASHNIDTDVAGTYQVTFSAKASADVTVEETITLTVTPTTGFGTEEIDTEEPEVDVTDGDVTDGEKTETVKTSGSSTGSFGVIGAILAGLLGLGALGGLLSWFNGGINLPGIALPWNR